MAGTIDYRCWIVMPVGPLGRTLYYVLGTVLFFFVNLMLIYYYIPNNSFKHALQEIEVSFDRFPFDRSFSGTNSSKS